MRQRYLLSLQDCTGNPSDEIRQGNNKVKGLRIIKDIKLICR